MTPRPRSARFEGGDLTRTPKVRLKVVESKYKEILDRYYEGAGAA